MKIKFEEEDGTLFAISTDCVWRRYEYDELMWAEIIPTGPTSVIVRWEDSYMATPQEFPDAEAAKLFVRENHYKHTPKQNGNSRYLG